MVQDQNKLDCLVRVVTPENIEFEYLLAGPFQRLPAFLFDLAFRVIFFIGVMIAAGTLASGLPVNDSLLTVLALLMFFGLSWFYGIFFETRFNGRTIGKMLFHLRVISVDGRPINGVQAALRNLLRLADMGVFLSFQVLGSNAPPIYAIPTMVIGLTAMTLSPKMQRLGDLAAGTMVIAEPRRRQPWNLRPEDWRAFGLAELIPANFQPSGSLAKTIGQYMENRRRISPIRRYEIAKHLAEPLIREFDLLPDTSPDLLLCALYVRIYLSPEQQAEGRARLREQRLASGQSHPVAAHAARGTTNHPQAYRTTPDTNSAPIEASSHALEPQDSVSENSDPTSFRP